VRPVILIGQETIGEKGSRLQ